MAHTAHISIKTILYLFSIIEIQIFDFVGAALRMRAACFVRSFVLYQFFFLLVSSKFLNSSFRIRSAVCYFALTRTQTHTLLAFVVVATAVATAISTVIYFIECDDFSIYGERNATYFMSTFINFTLPIFRTCIEAAVRHCFSLSALLLAIIF